MIDHMRGKLVQTALNRAVVEVSGIGFGIKTTRTTLSKLSAVGEEVTLYTYLHVREDALELYGFADEYELTCYRMLIGVSGVGPKAALSILSEHTPEQFSMVVASEDAKSLTRSAGVGSKTAQRIVLELKDKVSSAHIAAGFTDVQTAPGVGFAEGNMGEAISALEALGFARVEIARVLAGKDGNQTTQTLIKIALQQLHNRT